MPLVRHRGGAAGLAAAVFAVLSVLVAMLVAGPSAAAAPATPATHHARTAVSKLRPYLALGDSVPFGYISTDGNAYVDPANFVGFPVYAGRWLHLHTVNAACPGEATGGFISLTDPDDNGCRSYRAQYPLHVAYTGTQLAYAESFLTAHPDTALVSIMLGANDGFLLEKQCNNSLTCILNGLPGLQQTIETNLETAISGMRATGYAGPIMIVNYYSLDYTDPAQTLLSEELNTALSKVISDDHLLLADTFTSMQAAADVGADPGNTCAAGLLNVNPSNTTQCDVHPSQKGARVLGHTVAAAYRAWHAKHPHR